MHVGVYLESLRERERELANALLALAEYHVGEPDICPTCQLLAAWSEAHVQAPDSPPAALEVRRGSYGLLLALHDLCLLAQGVHLRWTVLGQVARALRDDELEAACAAMGQETDRQLAWLQTRIVELAPQALIASP